MAGSGSEDRGRIFISYRRQETAYPAGWLYEHLAAEYGAEQIFKDIDSIHLGDDFVERIAAAVASCEALLALIGDQWLTITGEDGRPRIEDPQDFVRLEIEAALSRDILVIPVLVDGATMPHESELPASLAPLARRQALELSPARFDFDTNRLLRSLEETLAEASPTDRSTHEPSDHPNRSTKPRPSRRRSVVLAGGAAGLLIVAAVVIAVFALGSGSDGEPTPARLDNIVFQDQFSDRAAGWDDTGDSRIGGHYRTGAYWLYSRWNSDHWTEVSFPRKADSVFPTAPQDVRVSVIARRRLGGPGVGYGVMCRADPGGLVYYQFAIWADRVRIEKFAPEDNGDGYEELGAATTYAVRTKGKNRLQAVCTTDGQKRAHLAFQVNGKLVASAIDDGSKLGPPLLTGSVGLAVAHGENSKAIEAEFDDFVVASA